MGISREPTLNTERVRCGACGMELEAETRFCWQCGEPRGQAGEVGDGGLRAQVADPLIGRVVNDRYRILSLLGRGGMGVVYRVEHLHIGKAMAMKLLHGELARKRDVVQRFRREAAAVSALSHPNTVQVFDSGQDGGLMYLVMELLEGSDLGAVIRKEGPLPFSRIARIGLQLAGSVGEANDKGIIHRDIKPENIMLIAGADGREIVKVLDFGLAKLRSDGAGNLSLTNAGAILGTPYYMAPEHIRGDKVDARADVYAMGATFYKALTGVPPFVAPTPMGVLTMHLTGSLRPPSARPRDRGHRPRGGPHSRQGPREGSRRALPVRRGPAHGSARLPGGDRATRSRRHREPLLRERHARATLGGRGHPRRRGPL
jgi:serine/threonine protein kinase